MMAGTSTVRSISSRPEHFYIEITNPSPKREITVTHIWFDTDPRHDVVDPDLPVRLRPDARWENGGASLERAVCRGRS
jgi:hypothetical protein